MTSKSLWFLDSGSEFLLLKGPLFWVLKTKKKKEKTGTVVCVYIWTKAGRQAGEGTKAAKRSNSKPPVFLFKKFQNYYSLCFPFKISREKAKEKKRNPLWIIIPPFQRSSLNNLLFLHCHYHSLYLINVLFFFKIFTLLFGRHKRSLSLRFLNQRFQLSSPLFSGLTCLNFSICGEIYPNQNILWYFRIGKKKDECSG